MRGGSIQTAVTGNRTPLTLDSERNWQAFDAFEGSARNVPYLECHTSVLSPGQIPHEPHTHTEEEILVLLEGHVRLNLPELDEVHELTPGQVVYYPARFPHSLVTTSDKPATYLMLKWEGSRSMGWAELGFAKYDASDHFSRLDGEKGFATSLLFEGRTEYLDKCHCHVSVAAPGAGYEAHSDMHDVVLVLLEGEVETLGSRMRPADIAFYASGEKHGLLNASADRPAKYLVIELHGTGFHLAYRVRSLISKLLSPRRWRHRIRRWFR